MTETERQQFITAYKLCIAFAKVLMYNRYDEVGESVPTWKSLGSTSRSIFMFEARDLAGIDSDEFLSIVRSWPDETLDNIWNAE